MQSGSSCDKPQGSFFFLLIKQLKCDLNKMPTDLDLPLPGLAVVDRLCD